MYSSNSDGLKSFTERRENKRKAFRIMMIPKLYFNETFRPIAWLAIVCTVFFSLVAITQSYYVESQARAEALVQLNVWAKDINNSIYINDRWDFDGYRNDPTISSNYYIIAADGLVIDIEGYISNLIPAPKFSLELKPNKIQAITTKEGQHWRLLVKPVKHGSVVLGMPNSHDSSIVDKELIYNAKKFDSLTVDESANLPPRWIGQLVEYAVLDSLSFLRTQWGGVPLEIDKDIFDKLLKDSVLYRKIGEKEYLALANQIVNKRYGRTVGLVLVSMDITLQQHALRAQKIFNYTVAGISLIVIVSIIGSFWVVQERQKRKHRIPAEEALKLGENQNIEFKESLEVDKTGQRNPGVLHDALRTIAAFLNTTGGTLFIGISDKPEIVGLEKDFHICQKHDSDGFELKLRSLLNRFHPIPLEKISIRFELIDQKTICAVDVQQIAKSEVVHFDGEIHIRFGNLTKKLDGEQLTNWLKERFHD
jgi:Putative DNA-binding domain